MAGRKIASTVGKQIGKIISPEDAAKRLKGRKRKLQTGPKADQKKLKDMQAAGKRAKKAAPKSNGKPKRNYNMDAKQFEPNKPQAAGMVKRESSLKSKKAKLAEEYDGLTASAKRAERLKGNKSKFFSVFKDRGMTPMKSGGYMKKKMAGGGPLKPVDKAKNPGLAELPKPVRNRMGFAKKGKKVSESMMEDYTSVPKELSAQAQAKKKKKMGGGKVYKRKYSGKVIKNNMSGQDLVNACYD
jgi:hypothetical protein